MVVDVQQLFGTPALVQVPNAHAFVVAHGKQELATRVEGYICDPVVVTHQGNDALARLDFPNLNCLVPRPAGQVIF